MLEKKIKLYRITAFRGSPVSVLVADFESHAARKTAWKHSAEIRAAAKANKTGYYGIISSAIYKAYISPELKLPQVLSEAV